MQINKFISKPFFLFLLIHLTLTNCVSGPYTRQGQIDLVTGESSGRLLQSSNPNFLKEAERKAKEAGQNIPKVTSNQKQSQEKKEEVWVLVGLGEWEQKRTYNKSIWDRDVRWMNTRTGWTRETGVELDFDPSKESSPAILKSPNWQLISIGPWHYVPKIDKEIRFIAWQGKSADGKKFIRSHIFFAFESKTEENKKIPAKPFKLSAPPSDDYQYSVAAWFSAPDNQNYNLILENYRRLLPGFWNWIFRNHELIFTGNVIEDKE